MRVNRRRLYSQPIARRAIPLRAGSPRIGVIVASRAICRSITRRDPNPPRRSLPISSPPRETRAPNRRRSREIRPLPKRDPASRVKRRRNGKPAPHTRPRCALTRLSSRLNRNDPTRNLPRRMASASRQSRSRPQRRLRAAPSRPPPRPPSPPRLRLRPPQLPSRQPRRRRISRPSRRLRPEGSRRPLRPRAVRRMLRRRRRHPPPPRAPRGARSNLPRGPDAPPRRHCEQR